MMLMPASADSLVVSFSWLMPSMVMAPLVGVYAPLRIFIRVDLPAPFSPSRACTSAAAMSKVMSRRAGTPAKLLVMWSIETMAVICSLQGRRSDGRVGPGGPSLISGGSDQRGCRRGRFTPW